MAPSLMVNIYRLETLWLFTKKFDGQKKIISEMEIIFSVFCGGENRLKPLQSIKCKLWTSKIGCKYHFEGIKWEW